MYCSKPIIMQINQVLFLFLITLQEQIIILGMCRALLMALTAKNKISFVDGSISHPSPDDQLFGAWNRCCDILDFELGFL